MLKYINNYDTYNLKVNIKNIITGYIIEYRLISLQFKRLFIYVKKEDKGVFCKPPPKPYHPKQNNSDKINQEHLCEKVSLVRNRL
jgi:hypothetical protein